MRTRKKNKRVTAILTADWHLRDDQPICRTDDFFAAQQRKVEFVSDLQQQHECLVFDAGDLFHFWQPSHFLTTWALRHLPKKMITVPGTERHTGFNIDNVLNKSGLSILEASNTIQIAMSDRRLLEPIDNDRDLIAIEGFEWGIAGGRGRETVNFKRYVALMHVMTYKGKTPWPGAVADDCNALLKKYDYDLIVTGHNHKTFTCELNGRLLVNPGSLTRQSADQIDHKPCVFLWYAEDNSIEQIFLPFDKDVVSREHIEREEAKEHRMEAYVKRLDESYEVELSFDDNLNAYYNSNNVRKAVKDVISEAMQ